MSENYPEPKLQFRLTAPAIDERGIPRRVGEVVEIEPSRRGPHHAMIEGVAYPEGMGDVPSRDYKAPVFADEGAHEVKVIAEQMAEMGHKIDALHTKMDHLMAEMVMPRAGQPLPPIPSNDEHANDE